MRLELANFQTDEARISDTTRWSNGVLEINADEILEPIRQNLLVDSVEIEIALPGQSTRIVTVRDVIEPRVKQSGDG
ncbi:MAG: glycine/sarcosine/betaine reductase component B subunit, partial [SAR202 cluster bacterium]|nr:glycine/sarcosine/betaine reductase component B subunit [SAR202 cluster bacterium]